ncbi:hypothetical protein BDB00DRAFT_873501 [Zychaea mexicana]|uniref:uncharacterized protein n=1 Tax=Zychaea mexicana TaxID=64656 RepID=UPI0022FF2A90|nr:uncharacterized protein BDB00DRAFT_873501 [Zychaea mexicana]KAI9492420.1 hypothetical protein BDB00DRAFT_873501 [Zychaea mexicana]
MIGENDVTVTPGLDQSLGFLDALPFDIICDIFLRLEQRDCLTCMAVCHAWRDRVPQYTKGVWTTLHLEQHKQYLENHRVAQCIGNHLKQVTLSGYDKDEELFTVLQKLISFGCFEVDSLEFMLCKIVYQGAFLRLLRQLAQNMTELKFIDHQWNLSFLHVLGACPRLKNFTFKPSSDGWRSGIYDQEPTVAAGLPSNLVFESLTHVCLDTVISKLRLKRILQRCPNLRCLISSNNIIDLYLHSPPDARDAIVDFDTLFTLCPLISHLEVNSVLLDPMDIGYRDNYPFWNERGDAAAAAITTSSGTGLRAFITREGNGYKPDQIMPLMQKNANNLELLWLGENIDYEHRDLPPANWSHLIQSIHAEQLRILFCDRLNCDGAAYGSMLQQCPAVEVLVLRSAYMTTDTFTGLETLERLKFLELQHITMTHDAVIGSAFARAMTVLGSRPDCTLETLHLLKVHDMNDQMLLAVPSIKTIKTLNIICSGRFITDDGLSDFAELLLQKGGFRTSSTIENILLSSLRCIPCRALCAFRELQTLKSLTIEHTRRVDSEGLCQLLNSTNSLQKLILKGTELIGPRRAEAEAYAKEKLGSGYQNDNYPVMYIGAQYLPVPL